MFKRCNAANAVFREQPEGLLPVLANFCVARRSHAALQYPITPRVLNCMKTVTSGGTNYFETASMWSPGLAWFNHDRMHHGGGPFV